MAKQDIIDEGKDDLLSLYSNHGLVRCNLRYHDDDEDGMGHLSDKRKYRQSDSPNLPVAGDSFKLHVGVDKKTHP